LAASGVRQQSSEDFLLAEPAEQRGRRMHCHTERSEQADQETHREPHWWEPNDKYRRSPTLPAALDGPQRLTGGPGTPRSGG
jgi:hypothetical protein